MLVELYVIMVLVAIGCAILKLVKANGPWNLISLIMMFSLAIASLGLESRTCGVCQSTFTQGNFTVDYIVWDEQQNYTYVDSKNVTYYFGTNSAIWDWIHLWDTTHDDWNITAWFLWPLPCEVTCRTIIYSDKVLAGVWAGLGFLMIYLYYIEKTSQALEDPKRLWYKH